MKILALAGLIVTGFASSMANAQQSLEFPSGRRDPDLKRAEELIVTLTNRFRKEHDLKRLTRDDKLDKTASEFARFMGRTDEYGHEADGRTPAERAEEQRYEYCLVGENIALQFSSAGFETQPLAERFVTIWKESPPHRENMLGSAFTETGVGIARGENSGRYYAVQMFGRPKSEQIRFDIVNRTESEVAYQLGGREFSLKGRYSRTHQQCTASKLVFHPDQAESETFQPKNGDAFTITSSRENGYRVERESDE